MLFSSQVGFLPVLHPPGTVGRLMSVLPLSLAVALELRRVARLQHPQIPQAQGFPQQALDRSSRLNHSSHSNRKVVKLRPQVPEADRYPRLPQKQPLGRGQVCLLEADQMALLVAPVLHRAKAHRMNP